MNAPIEVAVIADQLTTIYITETITVTAVPSELVIRISKRSPDVDGLATNSDSLGIGSSKSIGLAIGITVAIVAFILFACCVWIWFRKRKLQRVRDVQNLENFDLKELPSAPLEYRTTFNYNLNPKAQEPHFKINPGGGEIGTTLNNNWIRKMSTYTLELIRQNNDVGKENRVMYYHSESSSSERSSLSTGEISIDRKLPQLHLKQFKLLHQTGVGVLDSDRVRIKPLEQLDEGTDRNITRQVLISKPKSKTGNFLKGINVLNSPY